MTSRSRSEQPLAAPPDGPIFNGKILSNGRKRFHDDKSLGPACAPHNTHLSPQPHLHPQQLGQQHRRYRRGRQHASRLSVPVMMCLTGSRRAAQALQYAHHLLCGRPPKRQRRCGSSSSPSSNPVSSMKSFFRSQLVSLHKAVQAASAQARRVLTPNVHSSHPPAGGTGPPAEACEQLPGSAPAPATAPLPRPIVVPADGRESPFGGAGRQQQQEEAEEEPAGALGVAGTDVGEREKQRQGRRQAQGRKGERDGTREVWGEAAGAQVSASTPSLESPPKPGMCPARADGVRASPECSGRKGRHGEAAKVQQGRPHGSHARHEPWHSGEGEADVVRPASAAREQGTEVGPARTGVSDGAKMTKKEKRAKRRAAAAAAAAADAASTAAAASPDVGALAEGAAAGGGCTWGPAAPPSPPSAAKVRRSARQAATVAGDAANAHTPTARPAPNTSRSGDTAVAAAPAAAPALPAVPPVAEEVPAPAPAPPAAAPPPPPRGVPASLAVSRGPTPALAAHAARRPRPKPLQPVAQLPVRHRGSPNYCFFWSDAMAVWYLCLANQRIHTPTVSCRRKYGPCQH